MIETLPFLSKENLNKYFIKLGVLIIYCLAFYLTMLGFLHNRIAVAILAALSVIFFDRKQTLVTEPVGLLIGFLLLGSAALLR